MKNDIGSLYQKAIDKSAYYKELYSGIENPEDIRSIRKLPIVDKENLSSGFACKSGKRIVDSQADLVC